ncbi:AcrR family transcriptional regulator [Parvibaculum indicum]|uniref:TetR/AcrR family transcriptional regulator n=1 Tax=Parvibaculum indicum TaxID=562969 RepID=UPI001420C705|nr:TetR/AcrR family transcriptional regulator [Parvibaculum indicum]NIJ40249.1 AcrR family transcriptional regulator [Parvibaculum indicum]
MARKLTPEEKIVNAALRLAGKRGWTDLSLADIAGEAKLGLGELSALFSSKAQILAAYARRIDAQVLKMADEEELADEPVRDRLFDVVMLRFDAMAQDKPALKRITEDLERDPVAALALIPSTLQSMGWMLEAAGIDSSGWRGLIRVRGLALFWARLLKVWLDDDEDQARTMAALDKRLRQGEEWFARAQDFMSKRPRPAARRGKPENDDAKDAA